MIDENEYLLIVSKTKADIIPFIDSAINDGDFRNVLVKHLLNNDSINIYYHSYLILNEVTKRNPSILYCCWDKFATLLKHKNSYHRNYGLDLIANLISEDKDNLFDSIFEDYYKRLYDDKISTRKYCICNSKQIIKNKPHLSTKIIFKIIDSLRLNTNSEKYQNFLLLEFIKLLPVIDNELLNMKYVREFLGTVLNDTKSDKIKREIKKYVIFGI